MCGICGYIANAPLERELFQKMNDTMKHRGPDDNGIETFQTGWGQYAGFGHRRLAVIDLSYAAHQPMFSNSGKTILVFNGEIYNFMELKRSLSNCYKFKSRSDAEVILAAYEKWGIECLNKIHGMFAIALYDFETDTLYLARDRAGKKPLYYWFNGETLVFASELKPIMTYPEFPKKINRESIIPYLYYGYIGGEDSIFENVYKVRPGMVVSYQNKKMKKEYYWNCIDVYHKQQNVKIGSYQEVKEHLKYLIEEAVISRLVADVPVGTFLSGGIDSSLVTALAQKNTVHPIKTFSIGFYDKEEDEAPFAREIAKYLHTDHTEMYADENIMLQQLEDIAQYYDEPFADSSQIPTMLVSQLARQQVTVALTGDGGDELFCGYPMYKYVYLAQKLDPIGAFLNYIINMPIINQLALLEKLPSRMRIIVKNRDNRCKTQIGGDNYIKKANELVCSHKQPIKRLVEGEFDIPNWAVRSMMLDMLYCLPDDFLTKVDRASMRYSLETRSPLLDTAVMEYSFAIPFKYKFKNYNLKMLLKDIAYDFFPRSLLDRPKSGFSIPLERWLKSSLRDRLVEVSRSNVVKKQGIFEPKAVQEFIDSYLMTPDKGRYSGENYSKMVWSLLIFQIWYNEYIEKI